MNNIKSKALAGCRCLISVILVKDVNAAHKNFTPVTHPSIWEAKEGL
jgi:hypothetical protein